MNYSSINLNIVIHPIYYAHGTS